MIIKVRVIPNSRTTDIVGRLGSILRVKLAAPSIEGKANKMLIKFLADFFEVRASKVFLRRGQRGREKIIEIEGRPEEELRQVLESIP